MRTSLHTLLHGWYSAGSLPAGELFHAMQEKGSAPFTCSHSRVLLGQAEG